MKKRAALFYPLIFAVFNSAVYTMAFISSWKSEDYTTLMLVFCASLGWGGLIFIKRGMKVRILYGYIIIALFVPPIYMELLHVSRVDPLWHRITFGLMVLAMLVMNLLISMYLKETKAASKKRR
jgi:hypothetical protein